MEPHHAVMTPSDKVAFALTKFLRLIADLFFKKKYMHRAVVLETVAAVPGMVAGMWLHLKSLRSMKIGYGKRIRSLLSEAENERMHLMTFIQLSNPTLFERLVVLAVQFIFWHFYFFLYIFFPRTAHRLVGYFEEEAVYSYTEFLREIDAGNITNIPAPVMAIEYWKLSASATLRDVVIAIRKDEQRHRDENHEFANQLDQVI